MIVKRKYNIVKHVEFIKPLPEKYLELRGFTGFECTGIVAPGLIFAVEKHFPIIKDIVDQYKTEHFEIRKDGINISLNAFFICVLNLGAIGVAIASVIAEAIAMLVQLWYLPNNFQKKMVFFPCKNYFIAGIVMLLALLGLNSLVMGNFGHLILNIVCGCLIYCAILILLKDTMVINTITKIKSKKYHG